MTKHVVISRFNEDLTWLKSIDYDYTIYNKGLDDINLPNIKLPNIGRESGTYIHHILINYHNLPDSLILLQANPFEHCSELFTRIKQFDANHIIKLADGLIPNDLKLVPKEHSDTIDIIVNELQLTDYLKNYDYPQYDYPHGSQWIIPKRHIIDKTLVFWQKLYKLHQNLFYAPWVLERMFHFIFETQRTDE